MDRLDNGGDSQVWFPQVEPAHVLQRRMEFWQASPAPYPRPVVQHLRSVERSQLIDVLEWFEAVDLERGVDPASGAHIRVLWHQAWQPHPETWIPTQQALQKILMVIRRRAEGVLPASELHPETRHYWSQNPAHRQWLDETPWPAHP